MENKITDIQAIVKDIYSYVANKQSANEIPAIELDILLEKTRNLYDTFTHLKHAPVAVEEKHEPIVAPQEVHQPIQQEPVQVQFDLQEEVQPTIVEVVETPVRPEPTPIQIEEPIQIQHPVAEQITIPVEQEKAESIQTTIQANESHTQSIAEALQSRATQQDLGSKLGKTHINDINTAIPLGDRFSIKAQLFNHNENLMAETISTLNNSANYDEALQYIKEKFTWNFEDKKVQKFMELVERRFI